MIILPSGVAQSLYVKNVNILDVHDGTMQPNMHLLMTDGEITSISAKPLEKGSDYQIIDGSGKYAIPGLFEMHAHFGQPGWVPMYLSYGVTGIRIMSGNDQLLAMRDSLEATNLPQPDLYIASPLIDGNPPLWGEQHTEPAIDTNTPVNPILQSYVDKGYKELKVYNRLPENKYLEILEFAQQNGLRVSGHLPYTLTEENFADPRHRSIEHMDGFVQLDPSSRSKDWTLIGEEEKNRTALYHTFQLKEIENYVQKIKDNQVWLCPTLALYANMGSEQIKSEIKESRYGKELAGLMNWWKAAEGNAPTFAVKDSLHQEILKKYFLDYPDRILAGTDSPNPYNPPGLGLHFELYHLSQVGFTNAQVLKIATLNAAEYLGIASQLGSIEEGKVANVVLLNSNPLEDIQYTRDIHAVIVKGTPVK
ncbi:amidohydrolase family protein [Litoribacter ruber]|uniref:amidohydrolase family protein n=1 Tax=Litoribacter ruber TaxID=702568 RepID=UPI001BD9457D|nr:amidohydrolase family protein [Litoribacter ruber]